MKIGLPSGVDLLRKSGVKKTNRSQKQPFPIRDRQQIIKDKTLPLPEIYTLFTPVNGYTVFSRFAKLRRAEFAHVY